jgi:lipopolysaccharide transport system ATP-binding protein
MTTTIRFENVSKRYNLGLTRRSLPSVISQKLKKYQKTADSAITEESYIWALKNVSFDLNQGESLALIGPNGAGKTTILKLLSRITKPSSGKIDTRGQLSALIELGAGFHPDLTGRENIYLNGTILGLKHQEIDQRFDEIVAFSELESFLDTPVKRYSSGMVVRLGFAVAACIEPDILLVDEVLAVGDAAFSMKCLKRIQSLLDAGTSIVFVSHNLYLVQAICKSAVYIDKGQIRHYGNVVEVVKAYERDIHQKRTRKTERKSNNNFSAAADFEITKVEVVGVDGLKNGDLRSDKPAEIRIHYQSYKDVGRVHLAAYLVRSDGLICCMMRTKLDDFLLRVKRGSGVIAVSLEPLQLIGGSYFAEVYFLNDSDSMVLLSGQSDWFNVAGSGLSYEDRSGVFEPNSKWSHFQDCSPFNLL